ncbi:flagellar M-ring protein FliF [Myxococcota bacterium]|nr:flagellar M-ring protein FliF [Myxococcota bacterium]MBU1429661.1 flagellar M-ring protein FliF [Myxococcota bacterium]MBU1898122.1 flagellar M-ring protein FliF [Myxococcota bacterium]
METILNQLKTQMTRLHEKLSLGQKIAVVGLSVALIVALSALLYYAAQPSYEPVYAASGQRSAQPVIEALEKAGVPYKVEGTQILVPQEMAARWRLSLSQEGLPEDVIFKAFDKGDFLKQPQKVMEAKLLHLSELTLAHSIMTIEGIESARVHLALPPPQLYSDLEAPPTATVNLNIRPGVDLSRGQIKGIAALVAGAVPKLHRDKVTIIDQFGEALNEDAEFSGLDDNAEHQARIEHELEAKALAVLDEYVGRGRGRVKISLRMNFEKVEKRQEQIDAENPVPLRERTLTEERQNGAGRVGGGAGAAQNDPNGGPQVVRTGDASNATRSEQDTQYAHSRTALSVRDRGPIIEQMSVAVLVDGHYEAGKAAEGAAEGDEAPAKEYVPRSAKELKEIKDLIGAAIGLQERRDQIQVSSVKFQQDHLGGGEEELAAARRQALLQDAIRYGSLVLVAALLVFLVLRPMIRFLTKEPEAVELLADGELPPEEAPLALASEEMAALEAEEETLIDRVRKFAQEHPDVAASVVRFWLMEQES